MIHMTSKKHVDKGCPLCGRKDEHVHIGNGHAYELYYGRKPLPGEHWEFKTWSKCRSLKDIV